MADPSQKTSTEKPWFKRTDVWIVGILVPIIAAIIGGLLQNPQILGLGIDPGTNNTVIPSSTEIAGGNLPETPTSTPEATPTATMPPTDAPETTPTATMPSTATSGTSETSLVCPDSRSFNASISERDSDEGHLYTVVGNVGDVLNLSGRPVSEVSGVRFRVLDIGGGEIAHEFGEAGGTASVSNLTLPATGTYEIWVSEFWERAMGYTIEIDCVSGNFEQSSVTRPQTLNCGDTLSFEISERDSDEGHLYTVMGNAGDVLNLSGRPVSEVSGVRFKVIDTGGGEIDHEFGVAGGTASVSNLTLPATGTYEIWVSEFWERAMGYTIEIDCVSGNFEQSSVTRPQTLNCGDTLSFEISERDSDEGHLYTFSGNKDDVLSLSGRPVSEVSGVRFRVMDTGGGEIAHEFGAAGGTASVSDLRLPATGTYEIQVSEFHQRAMAYTLEVICG